MSYNSTVAFFIINSLKNRSYSLRRYLVSIPWLLELPTSKFHQNIDKEIWSKLPVLREMVGSKRQAHFSSGFWLQSKPLLSFDDQKFSFLQRNSFSDARHSTPTCYSLPSNAFLFGEGNGTPLQYSCLENPMDGGTWWAAVHGGAGSRTRLSDFTFTFHFHALEKAMATHSSVLAWRIPVMSLVGCRLWGSTDSDMTEAA